MQKLIFVIGAPATGKSYFIRENYSGGNYCILNIYDYQQREYEEAGFGEGMGIPSGIGIKCLFHANADLLEDIIENLKLGKDIVVEHTLFKMKRRLSYIDEIRKAIDVKIVFYVMCPTEDQWMNNVKKRELIDSFGSLKRNAEFIEFPNRIEGIDEIYKVIDGRIQECTDLPVSEDELTKAREELKQEEERIKKEEEESLS